MGRGKPFMAVFAVGPKKAPLTRYYPVWSWKWTNKAYWTGVPGSLIQLLAGRINLRQEALKKETAEPEGHALGRSHGEFTSKIHLVCDRNGIPLAAVLSGGQRHDSGFLQPVLESVSVPQKMGRPTNRPQCLVADKAYDAKHIRRYLAPQRNPGNDPPKGAAA